MAEVLAVGRPAPSRASSPTQQQNLLRPLSSPSHRVDHAAPAARRPPSSPSRSAVGAHNLIELGRPPLLCRIVRVQLG